MLQIFVFSMTIEYVVYMYQKDIDDFNLILLSSVDLRFCQLP